MLERFNFYDLYAYLIPGLATLGLAWLPYLLAGGALPNAGLSEGLVVVIVAYVAGQLLQTLAKELWSSSVSWLEDKRVYPTDALLSERDTTFSQTMKRKLKEHIGSAFQIDFSQPRASDDAWRLCRTALKTRKSASYVEQYHGMYNFMKGVATAFAYASPYYLGWAVGTTWKVNEYVFSIPHAVLCGALELGVTLFALNFSWKSLAVFLLIPIVLTVSVCLSLPLPEGVLASVIGLLVVQHTESFFGLFRMRPKPAVPDSDRATASTSKKHSVRDARATRYTIAVAVFAGGVILGVGQIEPMLGAKALLLAGIAWIMASRCAAAYHFFAKEFAAAVYRDYWAVVNAPKPETGDSMDEDSE